MIIALMVLVIVMDGLDASIVQVALPEMSRDLGMSVSDGAFIVIAYLVPLAGLCMPLARVAEAGRVRLMLRLGVVIFLVTSVVCAAAPDRNVLVLARFVQGFGAAVMVSTAPIMAVRMLGRERRHLGMAYLNAAGCIAIVIGPSVGGIVTGLLSWHWIFLVNVPICILMLLMSSCMPRDGPVGRMRMPEPARAAAMFVAVGTGLVALDCWTNGTNVSLIAPLAVVAVASVVAFVLLGRKAPVGDRLILPPLRGNRTYYILTLVYFLSDIVGCGVFFILPHYLSGPAGYSTLMAGLLLSLATIMSAAVSIPAGRWCRSMGCRLPASISLAIRVVFCLMLAVIDPAMGAVFLIIQLVLMGLSFGISGSSQSTRMVERVDSRDRGSAASAVLFVNYIGNALGVALFALIFRLSQPDGLATDISLADPSMILTGVHGACLFGAMLSVVCLIISMAIPDPNHGERVHLVGEKWDFLDEMAK